MSIHRILGPSQDCTLTAQQSKVLIVDNDEHVLVALERVLEDLGYATATAVDQREAFQFLSQDTFDLLVLDDCLSDRDCVEVVADLRRSELMPPLVVVTYNRSPLQSQQTRLRLLGVYTWINKRAHTELAETVRELLARPERKGEGHTNSPPT